MAMHVGSGQQKSYRGSEEALLSASLSGIEAAPTSSRLCRKKGQRVWIYLIMYGHVHVPGLLQAGIPSDALHHKQTAWRQSGTSAFP